MRHRRLAMPDDRRMELLERRFSPSSALRLAASRSAHSAERRRCTIRAVERRRPFSPSSGWPRSDSIFSSR